MNQQKDIIRDARVLGTPKMLLLGLQHMFAMFGATILVPILVNSYFQSTSQVLSVQVTLFCAGFGTLFFHLCTKFKVPAFLGSSFAFLGGFSSVAALDTGIFANMADKEKLQYACGGIVVAGLLYLILALIIRCVGVKRVMRFLPPVVTWYCEHDSGSFRADVVCTGIVSAFGSSADEGTRIIKDQPSDHEGK